MRIIARISSVVLLATLFGCGIGGESTQQKMLRMAKTRSLINQQQKAEEEADPPRRDPPSVAKPQAKTPESKPKSDSAKASPENDRPARKKPAVPQSEPANPKERLLFSRLGEQVAFIGEDNSIGIYDVETKALARQVFNPKLAPRSIAISGDGTHLVSGGQSGELKVFELESMEGLDQFQQDRVRRREALPPREAHRNAVTAVAIDSAFGIAASGDAKGEIKLWSSDTKAPTELNGDPTGYSRLVSFQDDEVLFAASSDSVSYWRIDDQNKSANELPESKSDGNITAMIAGAEGKGLAVGDSKGRVMLWTPKDGGLDRLTFLAHQDGVAALGYADSGNTLITASASGEVAKWRMPIQAQPWFLLSEPPAFAVASPNGQLLGAESRGRNLDMYSLADGSAVRRHSVRSGGLTAASFAGDGDIIAMANERGTVEFQDSNRRRIALLNLDVGILSLMTSPVDGQKFAFAADDGTVGVANFPKADSEPLPVVSELAALNQSGTAVVTAAGSELRLIDLQRGTVAAETRVVDDRVTALAVALDQAFLGTASGKILSWAYLVRGSKPQPVESAISRSSGVTAIGLTPDERVCSVDSSGQVQISRISNERSELRGSVGFSVSAFKCLQNGSIYALDDQGQLRFSRALAGPFELSDEGPWTAMFGHGERVAVVDETGTRLSVWDQDGVSLAEVRRAGEVGIVDADVAEETLVITLADRSVEGFVLPTRGQRDRLTGPTLDSVQSSDGSVVVVANGQGELVAFSSDTADASQSSERILEIEKGSKPLALSADGSLLCCVNENQVVCYDISDEQVRRLGQLAESTATIERLVFVGDAKVVLSSRSGRLMLASLKDSSKPELLAELETPIAELLYDTQNGSAVCLHADGSLSVVSVDGGEITFRSTDVRISSIAIGTGELIATTVDGALIQIDWRSNKITKLADGIAPGDHVISVDRERSQIAVVADGRIFSFGVDSQLLLSQEVEQLEDPVIMTLRNGVGRIFLKDGAIHRFEHATHAQMVPKGRGLQALRIGSDGNWILGVRTDGRLVRWGKRSRRISSAYPAKSLQGARDVVQIDAAGGFAVLTENSEIVPYNIRQDRATKPIPIPGKSARLLAVYDRTVAVASDRGALLVDLKNRTRAALGSKGKLSGDDDELKVIALPDGARLAWLEIREDGSYVEVGSSVASNQPAQFNLATETGAIRIANGLILSYQEKSLSVHRTDGSLAGQVELQMGPVACFASLRSNADAAVCDGEGNLTIFRTARMSSKRYRLPIKGVRSIAWSDDGNQIVATDGQRMATIDSHTGRTIALTLVRDAVQQIVTIRNGDLWFTDQQMRMRRLVMAELDWQRELGEKIAGVAWSASGARIGVLTGDGQAVALDAASGDEIWRTRLPSTDASSLTSVPASERFAFLVSGNRIALIDANGDFSDVKINSPYSLRTLCASSDGTRLLATNTNGQIAAWDFGAVDREPSYIPTEVRCTDIIPTSSGRIVAFSDQSQKVSIASESTRVEIVGNLAGQFKNVLATGDGRYVAAVDGSNVITVMSLADGSQSELVADDVNIQSLAASSIGNKLVTIGNTTEGDLGALMVWDLASGKTTSRINLQSGGEDVAVSDDGQLIAVAMSDGRCEVYDGRSSAMLEAVQANGDLDSIAFSMTGKNLILARKGGTVSVVALSALGTANAGESEIVSLGFHRGGEYLLSSSADGQIILWSRSDLSKPKARFGGMEGSILHSKVSADGRYVVAVFDDESATTCVWDVESGDGTNEELPPTHKVSSSVRVSSAALTSDSKYLLLGGEDGKIRAWSLEDNREIARFKGHSKTVVDIAPLDESGKFVSGGLDRSIRSWRFPTNLPAPDAQVPQGALADASDVQELPPAQLTANIQRSEPYDAARQALIAGATSERILELMMSEGLRGQPDKPDITDRMDAVSNVRNMARQALLNVMGMEATSESDPSELSRQRRQLSATQRGLTTKSGDGQSLTSAILEDLGDLSDNRRSNRYGSAALGSSFSDGFSNLVFVSDTNFRFETEREFRPVQLLFAERFLYAARTSSIAQRRAEEQARKDRKWLAPDFGDNGSLLSWDYRYSGLQAHEWSIKEMNVSQILPMPNSAGVFTVPQVIQFSQDGRSRELNTVRSWATSNQPPPATQYIAVGLAGSHRTQDDILRVYDVADLALERMEPVSRYRSFEGVITAMAFANRSPTIAFAVRERAVHRLFVADADTLSVRLLEEVDHSQPWMTKSGDKVIRNESAAQGVLNLAFTPDDNQLFAQTQFEGRQFKFSSWKMKWDGEQLLSWDKSFREHESKSPFFASNVGGKPIYFNTTAGADRILVRRGDFFSLLRLTNLVEERRIKFVETHHDRPPYAVSGDGSWLIMGDDNGMAHIYDTIKGRRYPLAVDSATEEKVKDKSQSLTELVERPAHVGPIVGVALSEPDKGNDYPAFAATIGEENKIKVWELFPILDPDSGMRSRHISSQEIDDKTGEVVDLEAKAASRDENRDRANRRRRAR